MADLATLGVVVTTKGITEAERGLDKLGKTGAKTEQEINRLAPAYNKAGMSAKQLANAQRQLPAQFTDIATGLATGQRPLQVLLQQGGQLKDVFGGVGPALRATVGYVVGLINPVTVLAAAVIGLGVAFKQASSEAEAFSRSIIFTGSGAELSVDALRRLADEIDRTTTASEGQAAKVIANVVSTGRFTEEQIRLVTEAAVALENIGQQAIEDTIAQYVKLAQDPVDALLKLNDTQNFLTRETLEQIQALEDQGRQAEATQLAIETLFRAQTSRAAEARRELGILSSTWLTFKGVVTETWDAITDGFRSADAEIKSFLDSLEDIDPELQKILAKIPQLQLSGNIGAATIRFSARNAGEVVDTTGDNIRSDEVKRQREAEEDLASDRRKWFEESIRYASEREKVETEILEVIAEGNRLGVDRAEIESRVAAIRQKFAEDEARRARRGGGDALKAERERQREEDRIRKEAERAEKSLNDIINKNAADLAGPAAQAAREYADAQLRLLGIQESLAAAGKLNEDTERSLAIAREQNTKGYQERLRVIEETKTEAEQFIDDLEFELRLMTLGNAEREKEIALRYAAADATEEQRQKIGELLERVRDNREAIQAQDDFRASFEDSVASVLDGSKSIGDAFKDFVDEILAQLSRIVARQLTESLFGSFGQDGGGSQGGFLSSLFGAFLGGGRAVGGPVSANKLYAVNETGKPELLEMHGRKFLLPGGDGQVTPLREGDGMGGGLVVNQVINVAGRVDPRTAYQIQREAQMQQRMAAGR